MTRSVTLQLLGPVALSIAIVAAESSQAALNWAPSSGWLWYFNMDWFAVFQQSHYAVEATFGGCAQSLVIAAPLLIVATLGTHLRRGFLLATSSNLTLAFVVFAGLSWIRAEAPLQPSLLQAFARAATDSILFAALACICFLSFAVSHLDYLRKLTSRTQ